MSAAAVPALSVVVPVCNEEENVGPLAREIAQALAGRPFELLFVDDGSTDATAQEVLNAQVSAGAAIRLLRHPRRAGQSSALCTGVRHARAPWIATLDGDGQNDPADIERLLRTVRESGNENLLLVVGDRRATRRDTWFRRLQSRVANGVRARMLGDATPDTGCGIKLMHRETFLRLPQFDHMHRFLPALYRRLDARIVSVPVSHRPRTRGKSKYGMFDRLWVGIVDLFGVMWLLRRRIGGYEAREE
jgi:dolichol-phosphate mannosyltransferase